MTFYIVTLVAKMDAQGQVVLDNEDGTSAVKEVHVWDERDHVELATDYARDGVLHLRKLGYQHSKSRPLEWRGEMSVFSPYLISIEVDLKSELRQKAGPVDFVPRPSREPAS